ncbi:Protein kinase domain [Carpediemonas membranifera]|uniref:Protein kinase domain n=1 Tax=Carpediemonas membranifera TaxID=201153 RepID=A0A8J6AUX3_9EUKA|nr:Protein kinase domain [Carpediemonas membranifera]|eukprot:KAG9394798.1 Protein kinase domain [Carpediemonas membranifera]
MRSIAFSPDGRTLVSGPLNKTIKQWYVATGALIRTISGHDGKMMGVAFSRDGTTIVSGSSDTTAKVWSALPRTTQFQATVNQLCSSPVAPDADIAIDPGDSEVLPCDLTRIILHFLATGLPRSFTMTLTRPAARVWLEDKFAKTDSDDEGLAKLIKLYIACICDQNVADFCSGAVSNVFLVDATIDQLKQVVTHVTSNAVPSSFTVTTADPATTVTLTDGLFSADRHALEVDAILSDVNCRMLQTAMAEQESRAEQNMELLRAELSHARSEVADLKATLASFCAFLQPAVRETWQWALGQKELGDDTSAEERTIRQLTGLAAEAEVRLAGFAEADAITVQLQTLGDYQHLKSSMTSLKETVEFYSRPRKNGAAILKDAADDLENANATLAKMVAVLARRTPQLVRLCPELEALTALSASLFTELHEMGLAHLMDLPEMRVDLSLSDFTVESTVSKNRALCQIVARDGQIYFTKTFKLDSAQQRKLCDHEAGILSRMAHSPTVPRLHFVLLDLSDPERKTGAIVMERLERHLRDASANSPDSLRRLLNGLLTAIHDLHSAGVCHRDIKPENVMLREDHPVLVEFETASNMDAVNATALAFCAPEEVKMRKNLKLRHREQQAADVYHAGMTTLALMAMDYTDFCRDILSLSCNKDLLESSTVNDDQLCTALLATVAVPDALREVLSGMLATHPEPAGPSAAPWPTASSPPLPTSWTPSLISTRRATDSQAPTPSSTTSTARVCRCSARTRSTSPSLMTFRRAWPASPRARRTCSPSPRRSRATTPRRCCSTWSSSFRAWPSARPSGAWSSLCPYSARARWSSRPTPSTCRSTTCARSCWGSAACCSSCCSTASPCPRTWSATPGSSRSQAAASTWER